MPKLQIDRIKIENFKCFDDLELNFSNKVNLFVGVNGSGKTALLEAISVATGCIFLGNDSGYQRPIEKNEIRINNFEPSNPQIARYVTSDYCSISGNSNDIEDALGYFSGKVVKDNNGNNIVLRNFSYTRMLRYSSNVNTRKDAFIMRKYGESIFKDFLTNNQKVFAPLISFLSTQRLHTDANQTKYQIYNPTEGRRQGYLKCLDTISIKSMILDWYSKASADRVARTIKGVNEINNVLENVDRALEFAAEYFELGKSNSASTQVNNKVIVWSESAYNYEIFFKIGNRPGLPFRVYSDGFRNVILLVMDLVWRASTLNPWLDFENLKKETHGVVMIDEVDLHLHPLWQGKVIPFLAGLLPNVQFFITTHSPSVISTFSQELGMLFTIDDGNVQPVISKYYGRTISDIIRNIQGGEPRPKKNQEEINEVLDMIETAPNDPKTKEQLTLLIDKYGSDDHEIIRAINLFEVNSD